MSNKIPCGGFYLDDMLNVNDSGELSIKGGTLYQQLVTDGTGKVTWTTLTLPVVFIATNDSLSATIDCNQEYEQLRGRLETYNFSIMSGQLYIESSKNLFTMVGCTQKDDGLEFLFVVPQDAGDGLAIGTILTVYYLKNGTITFTRPRV